jgi:tetratricopeptide (TPR) repeat protein
MKSVTAFISIVAISVIAAGCGSATQPATPSNTPAVNADALMRGGAAAFARDEIAVAAGDWERAAQLYADAGRDADRCDALFDLAKAYQSVGSFKEAIGALQTALPLARKAHDRGREIDVLWSVNDQASAELVQQFYTSLKTDPKRSKARAMQRAQLSLLHDPRYRHPCYWGSVSGDWKLAVRPIC